MNRVRKQLGFEKIDFDKYTGKGVYIAVLDSGIEAHPDLRGRILAFRDFCSNELNKNQHISNFKDCFDDNGHGTHVAGILAGNGNMSNGKYKGIAPECNLIIAKVLDNRGGGSLRGLINSLDWIIYLLKFYPIRVVNISIEIDNTDENDRIRDELKIIRNIINELWDKNILVIAAAGNKGPAPMSLSPIGENDNCVCVGCHDGKYKFKNGIKPCCEYSGRGPSKENRIISNNTNPLKKPDIVAPGTHIISCNNRYITQPYISKSGTSMSAPIVSGACALCIQKNPYISNCELIKALKKSADDIGERWSLQGAGMINIYRLLHSI